MFERLLFASDLSLTTDGVVPYVIEAARVYRSKVYAMHVRASEWGGMQEEALKRLEDQMGTIAHEIVIRDGDIRTTLLNFIQQQNIDLMVVGTHGRTGLGRVLLGSVAEAIFREAPCPVLTVAPRTLREERSSCGSSRAVNWSLSVNLVCSVFLRGGRSVITIKS